MNPTTVAAALAAVALIAVALINAWSARMVSRAEQQAREANLKASEIMVSVDGTQTKILEELHKLVIENADRGGQLKERDRAEARRDLLNEPHSDLTE
jgi:predicted negative regulator of RcsB-dependent stress response